MSPRKDRRGLESALAKLRPIGAAMANVCFNWSQESNRVGALLTENERRLLKQLQVQWDDAVRDADVFKLLVDGGGVKPREPTGRERAELRAEMTALQKRRQR